MLKKKRTWIILGIVAVLIAGGVYLATRTANEPDEREPARWRMRKPPACYRRRCSLRSIQRAASCLKQR